MCFSNIPTKFCTDPGKNVDSSRYYVFKNGTIRAKFAEKSIHVRPNKNICYVSDDIEPVTSRASNSMKLGDIDVTFADAMDPKGKYQKPTVGLTPFDFFLNKKGEYDGGYHHGHPISTNFSARIGDVPVDLAKFDQYIMETYSDGEGKLRSLEDHDASLEGYLKWLSENE